MKADIPEKVRAAGGAIFAVTSEPQTLAREAAETWELDFEAIGDPHHEIADACRARGWLDLFVNPRFSIIGRGHTWAKHPKGYFQPGVLALSREGRVLYRWRSRPTRRNAGGATSRPLASDVWAQVETRLSEPADAPDAEFDQPAQHDMPGPPWPIFVTLLLANGNFVRPQGFGLQRGGPDDVTQRVRRALAKLALFSAGWIAALVFLPTAWVAAAFVAWALFVTPGIVEMHRDFQSVPEN